MRKLFQKEDLRSPDPDYMLLAREAQLAMAANSRFDYKVCYAEVDKEMEALGIGTGAMYIQKVFDRSPLNDFMNANLALRSHAPLDSRLSDFHEALVLLIDHTFTDRLNRTILESVPASDDKSVHEFYLKTEQKVKAAQSHEKADLLRFVRSIEKLKSKHAALYAEVVVL